MPTSRCASHTGGLYPSTVCAQPKGLPRGSKATVGEPASSRLSRHEQNTPNTAAYCKGAQCPARPDTALNYRAPTVSAAHAYPDQSSLSAGALQPAAPQPAHCFAGHPPRLLTNTGCQRRALRWGSPKKELVGGKSNEPGPPLSWSVSEEVPARRGAALSLTSTQARKCTPITNTTLLHRWPHCPSPLSRVLCPRRLLQAGVV